MMIDRPQNYGTAKASQAEQIDAGQNITNSSSLMDRYEMNQQKTLELLTKLITP